MLTIGLGLASAVFHGVAAIAWLRQRRAAAAAGGALGVVLVIATYLLYPQAGETETATVRPLLSAANMDLDGNSVPDLALYNDATRGISVWLMKPGQPVAVDTTPVVQTPQPLWEPVAAAADFDGSPGLVLQNSTTRQISFWVLGGNTPTHLARSIELPLIPLEGWSVAAAADFDKNGNADLLLWNARTREVSIWLMGGTSGLERIATPVVQSAAEGWAVCGCSDFDANGTPDLVLENRTAGSISLWLMGRNGTVHSSPVIGSMSTGWRIVPSGY